MERPVALSVSKVDLIDQEPHGKRSTAAEVIILIPDMHMLDVHLDAIKEGGEEGETDGLLELFLLLSVLLFLLVQALLTLFSSLLARLALRLVLLMPLFLLLLFKLCFFGSYAPVHFCDIDELVSAIVHRIDVPRVVLHTNTQSKSKRSHRFVAQLTYFVVGEVRGPWAENEVDVLHVDNHRLGEKLPCGNLQQQAQTISK